MQGKDYIGLGVGAMIFNNAGELLLMQRGQQAKNERGCWEIPGGTVEFGETMAQAVVREIKEELGVVVEVVQQLLSIDHLIPAEGQHWVATPFLVRIASGTPKVMEPHKCNGVGWFALHKLPQPLAITTNLNIQSYQHYLEQS
jgi:mutator protein MutT